MDKKPLVSIIMPTLNSANTIGTSLLSIEYQDYPSLELIIVDGSSTDSTLAIVDSCNLQRRVVSQESKGIWGAMNEGINHSKGDYLFFLNSDDIIALSSISQLVNFAEKGSYDCVWLPTYSAGGYKKVLNLSKLWLGIDRVTPGHSASFFIKRSSQLQIGLYNESIKYCADHDLFYRIFNSGMRFSCLDSFPSAFGVFTHGGFSSTNRYLEKAGEEFRFRCQGTTTSLNDLIYCFCVYPLKLIWGGAKIFRFSFNSDRKVL